MKNKLFEIYRNTQKIHTNILSDLIFFLILVPAWTYVMILMAGQFPADIAEKFARFTGLGLGFLLLLYPLINPIALSFAEAIIMILMDRFCKDMVEKDFQMEQEFIDRVESEVVEKIADPQVKTRYREIIEDSLIWDHRGKPSLSELISGLKKLISRKA